MAVKVGSFAKPTAAATASQAVTGVGFTPQVLFLWTAGKTAADDWSNDYRYGFGCTTGASNSYSVALASLHGADPTNVSGRCADVALTIVEWGETLLAECALTSFDGDGFTLSWTTNNAEAYIINYMAIGGITAAKIVNWSTATSTGNKSVTGAGFQPEIVMHFAPLLSAATGLPASYAGAQLNIGAMTSAAQWTQHVTITDGSASSSTREDFQTDKCLGIANAGSTYAFRAGYISLDEDGFTVNFSTATATAYHVFSLCMSGADDDFSVGAFQKTNTTPGPVDQAITGTGFAPSGLLFIAPLNTSVGSSARHMIGATDATNQRAAEFRDITGQAAASCQGSQQSYVYSNGTAQLGSLKTMDADGFTLTWNPNVSNINWIYYLAIRTPANALVAPKAMHYKRLRTQ